MPENFAKFKIYEEVFEQQKNIFSYLKSLIEEKNEKHPSFFQKTLISLLEKIPDISNKPAYELPQYIMQKIDSLLSKWYIPEFFKKKLKKLRKKMEKVSNNLRETHYFIKNGELFNTDTIWIYSNNPKELEKYGGHKAKDKLGETLGYNQITTRKKFVDFLNKNADKISEINSKGLADYIFKSFIKSNNDPDKAIQLIISELNTKSLKKMIQTFQNVIKKEKNGYKSQLHQLIAKHNLEDLINKLNKFTMFENSKNAKNDYDIFKKSITELKGNNIDNQNPYLKYLALAKDVREKIKKFEKGKFHNIKQFSNFTAGFILDGKPNQTKLFLNKIKENIESKNIDEIKKYINYTKEAIKINNNNSKYEKFIKGLDLTKDLIEKGLLSKEDAIKSLTIILEKSDATFMELAKITKGDRNKMLKILNVLSKYFDKKLINNFKKALDSKDPDKIWKAYSKLPNDLKLIIGGGKIIKSKDYFDNKENFKDIQRFTNMVNNAIHNIDKAKQFTINIDANTSKEIANVKSLKDLERLYKNGKISKEQYVYLSKSYKSYTQANHRYETVYLPSQQEKQKETKKNTSKQENNSNTNKNKEENSDDEPDPHQETLSYKSVDGLIQVENPFLQKNNKNPEQKEIIQANSIEDANKKLLKIGLENFGFVKIENIHFPKFTQDTINKLGFDITKPLSKEEIEKGQQLLTIQFLHTIESGNKKLTELQKEIIKEIKNDLKTKPFSEDIFSKLLNFINNNPELISNIYDISTNTLKIENLKNTNSIEFEKIKKEYI